LFYAKQYINLFLGGYMKPVQKLNENENFMIGVFFILVVMSVFLLTGCGKPGSQGATGSVGTPGQAATITESPATALECPTGGIDLTVTQNATTAVYSVCNGIAGQSIVGPTGPQGAPGTDLTPINVVQFCPGTTNYANEFNEVGYCIAGNLYAVYSANDGFMSEIPPGNYTSDGIGSSCNFTVLANCGIQN
jgi:hypothetical protein